MSIASSSGASGKHSRTSLPDFHVPTHHLVGGNPLTSGFTTVPTFHSHRPHSHPPTLS